MKNIELKIQIHDFREIKQKLSSIGAKFEGVLSQIDTYYNYPNGRLKAREINKEEFVIIYYKRPNKADSKVSDYKVYHLERHDFSQIKQLFSDLYGEKVVVQKIRNLWIYKNARIHLDEVSNLGSYLELETVVKDPKNMQDYQLEHQKVIRFLEIGDYKKLSKSYSDMILENNSFEGKKIIGRIY